MSQFINYSLSIYSESFDPALNNMFIHKFLI